MSATAPRGEHRDGGRRQEVAAVAKAPPAGVVHLTIEGAKVTRCGVGVTHIVPFREFSEHPCPACVKKRMEAAE